MKLLIFMLICHVLDDFVFQPQILSKLKQKKTWQGLDTKYDSDYLMAEFIHALSWSCMITLPWCLLDLMTYDSLSPFLILGVVSANTIIHFFVDDLKANQEKINLVQDQLIHFVQIFITWYIFLINY